MYHLGKRTTFLPDSIMYKNLRSAKILRTPKDQSFSTLLGSAHLNLQPYNYVGAFDRETAPSTQIMVNNNYCAVPTSGAYTPKFATFDYPKSVLPRSSFYEPKLKIYESERDLQTALIGCSAGTNGACRVPMYKYTNQRQIMYYP